MCNCLTMGVTVIGMSDTAEPLLSSCVPDLQRLRERQIGKDIFPYFWPLFAQPWSWSSLKKTLILHLILNKSGNGYSAVVSSALNRSVKLD